MFIITQSPVSQSDNIIVEAIHTYTSISIYVDKPLDTAFTICLTIPNPNANPATFIPPIELSVYKTENEAIEAFHELLKALDAGRAYYDMRRILS